MSDDRELFRRAAEHAVDYRRSIATRPQRPEQTYAEALAAFEAPTPEQGSRRQAVIDDAGRSAPTRACTP